MSDPATDGFSLFPIWRQAAADFVASYSWGDVIEPAWLYRHFEIDVPPEPMSIRAYDSFRLDFLAAFSPFRAYLLEQHRMDLRAVGHGRYEVIRPSEQVDEARDVLNRTMRKALERATRSIEHVETARLDDGQRRHRIDMQSKLSLLEGMVRRHRLPR
jgi:hypothetical protein